MPGSLLFFDSRLCSRVAVSSPAAHLCARDISVGFVVLGTSDTADVSLGDLRRLAIGLEQCLMPRRRPSWHGEDRLRRWAGCPLTLAEVPVSLRTSEIEVIAPHVCHGSLSMDGIAERVLQGPFTAKG